MEDKDDKRYILENDAIKDNYNFVQNFSCPDCGSWNTGQSTHTDYCNSCGWSQGY